jgi:hypothetical protein
MRIENADSTPNTIRERFQKEVGESMGGAVSVLCSLQLLSGSQFPARDPCNISRVSRACMELAGFIAIARFSNRWSAPATASSPNANRRKREGGQAAPWRTQRGVASQRPQVRRHRERIAERSQVSGFWSILWRRGPRQRSGYGSKAILLADDLLDADAEVSLDHHHLSAGNHAVVDDDIDRFR